MKLNTLKYLTLAGMLSASTNLSAAILEFDFEGLFTLLDPQGEAVQNTSAQFINDPTWGNGMRTQISGTLFFDTVAFLGGGTVDNFQFQGQDVVVTDFANAMRLDGGLGGIDPTTNRTVDSFVVSNMLFNWNGYTGIPVSTVFETAGLMRGLEAGLFEIGKTLEARDTIGGIIPASNDIMNGTLQIGPAFFATLDWDTSFVGSCDAGITDACLGELLTGDLPLISDSIGGSPMIAGPLAGNSANFDITSMTMTNFVPTPVPLPASIWLLFSGLIGFVSVSRFTRPGKVK